jgi:hypothetical protein
LYKRKIATRTFSKVNAAGGWLLTGSLRNTVSISVYLKTLIAAISAVVHLDDAQN